MQTNKAKIEDMCKNAGMSPAERRSFKGYDLFLSDGFSLPPHKAFRRFGVDEDEFPNGCYVTFWWIMKGEERLFVAAPVIFDHFHDPEYDKASKKKMRLNAATKAAGEFLDMMKRNLH